MAETLQTRNRSGASVLGPLDGLLGQANPLFYLTTIVMVASLFLGGGARGGFLSDAILQLTAIPLLLFSLWRLFEIQLTRQMRIALLFCLAIAALPLVQLIPLPPWLWTALPNRQPSANAFQIMGQAVPWMPISVSPDATWVSTLSLIAPLAIFLGTLLLSYRERRLLSLVILSVGIVAVFVGLIQVAQGPESPLRFFQVTNPSEAVGFFANRNHFASLIYALILFAVPWVVHASTVLGTQLERRQYDVLPALGAIGGFTVLVVFLAGEAMARSRAGLGLTIVALFGAMVLAFFHQTLRPAVASSGVLAGFIPNRLLSGFTPTKLLLAAIALAVTFSLQFALYRIKERFAVDAAQDSRVIFIPNTIEAAKAYMPFGSGLGTFLSVYPLFEKPQDGMVNAYVNHAHNDAVEVWLETGIFGIVLIGFFLTWIVLRSVAIWRNAPPPGASELDWSLVRAATIVIGLVLAHSLVDYPLRTGAMMAIMVFACALLIEPPTRTVAGEEPGLHVPAKRIRSREKPGTELVPSSVRGSRPPKEQEQAKSDGPPPPQDRRWGSDINWPEEWSTVTPGSPDGPQSPSKKSEK